VPVSEAGVTWDIDTPQAWRDACAGV
jgi:hypothetical protein